MTYQPGEIIDIVIEDATVLEADENGIWVEYAADDTTTTRCTIHFGVHVKRLVPAEGPPQLGEVWEDTRGVRFLAIDHYGVVRLHDGRPGTGPVGYLAAEIHHQYGPIKRVLAAPQDDQPDAAGDA